MMPQHDRYYVMSHSFHQDPMWILVKKFIEDMLKAQKVNPDRGGPAAVL